MDTLIPIVLWSRQEPCESVERLLRTPPTDPEAERVAREELEEIEREGDAALTRLVERHDGVRLTPDQFQIPGAELAEAARRVPRDFLATVRAVRRRVARLAKSGLRRDWHVATAHGGRLGERFVPLRRVGIYIPGGAAPLVSTVLMTVPLAQVAGVTEIAVCTPPRRDGSVDPHILAALHECGVHEVYRLGGVAAIGALALGTETIPPVEKIVGPGGPYVTAAKRLVYGRVALDMVAGPSEIAVLADGIAPADWIAADLLSQAEHGSGRERVLLVTPSRELAERVRTELLRRAAEQARSDCIRQVLSRNAALVVTPDLDAAVDLINRFAPEHLEIMTRNPRTIARRIRCAGAIFVGKWTPESAGDYAAGPSHVLPTGGTARFFSGLSVEDFRRRISMVELTRKDLKHLVADIVRLGEVEGLRAHVQSATLRFESDRR